jgi:ssDNA-binding Zn-finger/Zn-ribbon topoisomerase 1
LPQEAARSLFTRFRKFLFKAERPRQRREADGTKLEKRMSAIRPTFLGPQHPQCRRTLQSQNELFAKADMDIVSPIIGVSAVCIVAMAVCRTAKSGQHDKPFGCHFAQRNAGRSTECDPLKQVPVIVR